MATVSASFSTSGAPPGKRLHYMQTRRPKKRQLALLFSEADMALLCAVQDALRPTMGDLSWAAVIRYSLRLAAAHLGIDAPDPLPLPPVDPPKRRPGTPTPP